MSNENPYQSPTTAEASDAPTLADEMQIASTGRRFANLILDYIFYMIFSLVIGLAIGFAMLIVGGEEAFDTDAFAAGSEPNPIVDFLLGMVIMLVYYVPQEKLFGRTLAKFITRTKVVSEDGSAATWGQIVGRTFSRFIPFEAFSFLGGKGYPVGWHDKLSKTRVVTV